MSDSFAEDYAAGDRGIKTYIDRLENDYERSYYMGIAYERRAKAVLSCGPAGSETAAYDFFRQAMDWFEKAEKMRPAGNDDAILRWNGCARLIETNSLSRREVGADFLE